MEDYNYIFTDEQMNSTQKVRGKIIETKTDKKQQLLLSRFLELDNLFPETIENNTSLHIISSDNFGSIELLKVLQKRLSIEEVFIATWISLESSANYSKNQRIENFTLTENEDLFNFHKNWMLELIGK